MTVSPKTRHPEKSTAASDCSFSFTPAGGAPVIDAYSNLPVGCIALVLLKSNLSIYSEKSLTDL